MKRNGQRLTLLSSHLIDLVWVNEPIAGKRNGTIMSNTDGTQSCMWKACWELTTRPVTLSSQATKHTNRRKIQNGKIW